MPTPSKSEITDDAATWRVIDANANRALEALRVTEEFARFILDDQPTTQTLKQLRHRLATALNSLSRIDRIAARDTAGDVGTACLTNTEYSRADLPSLLTANISRAHEALRCLEEFCKISDPNVATQLESLRYEFYTVAQSVELQLARPQWIDDARLYVLIDGSHNETDFQNNVAELVRAAVDVIQLRDKRLSDRELVGRGRLAKRLTLETSTRLLINDRPDLALLTDADGVHLGQDEMSVSDARKIVGPRRVIGVSTHNLPQAQQAVLDGANYIGCGPTFPSATKSFDQFPGIAFLHQVSREIRLPAFAIGGINHENVAQVVAAGISRIAVSAAASDSSSRLQTLQALRNAFTASFSSK